MIIAKPYATGSHRPEVAETTGGAFVIVCSTCSARQGHWVDQCAELRSRGIPPVLLSAGGVNAMLAVVELELAAPL